MNSWTIRTKLTFWYTSIFGGTLVLFGLLTYLAFSYANNKRIDVGLKEEAEGIAHYERISENFFRKYVERISNESDEEWASGKYVAILNHTGNLQFRSGNLKDVHLSLNSRQITEILSGKTYFKTVRSPKGRPLRIITISKKDTQELIQIGIVMNRDGALKIFSLALAALGCLAIIGSWFGGLFMAKKALKPINHMIKELQKIESEQLDKRLTLHSAKDEINELSGVINEMLSRLENSFNQIRQFTANASHELRTPLAIMKTGIEVSLSKERDICGYQQVLAHNLEDLGRLSKIIENLFILTRADAGRYELHKQRMNLYPVIAEIAEQLKLIAEPKNIFVSMEKIEDAFIEGDELLIRMMLLNLIDNAAKYTQTNGTIQLSLCKDNGWAKIAIRDNGIGISQEDVSYIFERFYRTSNARAADHAGGGLGLSLCQWIVKSHHGSITVKSELRKGSAFMVTLPTC
ncbi:MAG: HAMP domain-containing protein [Candidatus Brocadia sp.]|nr:MAG: HAMP domain-containing protein [Candidatus Brocadia sp.]